MFQINYKIKAQKYKQKYLVLKNKLIINLKGGNNFLLDAIKENNVELVRKILYNDWTLDEIAEWKCEQDYILESTDTWERHTDIERDADIERGNIWEQSYKLSKKNHRENTFDIKNRKKLAEKNYVKKHESPELSPLILAFDLFEINGNDSRIIMLLIKKKIYKDLDLPIWHASKYGLTEIIKLLLYQKNNINEFNNKLELSALDIAIINNKNDTAIFLIKSGINIYPHNLSNAIESAMKSHNVNVIELLLIKNINVDKYDFEEIINLDNFKLIKILIEKGNVMLLHLLKQNKLLIRLSHETKELLKLYVNEPRFQYNLWALLQSKKKITSLLSYEPKLIIDYLENDESIEIIKILKIKLN